MQKKVNCLSLLILLVGILFISGCATQNAGGANAPAASQPAQGTGKAQGISFSLPAELPIAYVGTPFTYSINPTSGQPPYTFSFYYHGIAYDGSACGVPYSGASCGGNLGILFQASTTQLAFTPEAGNEGEYMLDVCVSDRSPEHRYNPVCKNVKLYIMSDTITVKGSGKVTSVLMWDPRASVFVRGKGDTAEDKMERRGKLVPLSVISSVSFNANLPPKDNSPGSQYSVGSSGGGSVRFEMTADPTSISQSVTGDAPCGTPLSDGTCNSLNLDSFQAVGDTTFGLNIINDGTADKVVDFVMTVRTAVSSDSKNYGDGDDAGTQISIGIGKTGLTLNAKDEHSANAVAPGSEIADRKVARVVVEPGSHVLQIGGIAPWFGGGGLGTKDCPVHIGISSGVSVTVADADLSDGNLPKERIWTTFSSDSKPHTYIREIE